MEYPLLIIMFYGILHALAPDHLSAIALFSIGKHQKETLFITLLFAFTHGFILYIMAITIDYIADEIILQYGDAISSLVILLMGSYMIYLALSNNIRMDTHHHQERKHTHIYYKHAHRHDETMLFTLATLMGVGGLRGMLVTLSIVSHHSIGVEMILAFVIGVGIVFISFGYILFLVNIQLSHSKYALRYGILSVGIVSVAVATFNLQGVLNVT